MERETFSEQTRNVRRPSTDKSLRTVWLAVLFQISWPRRLSREEIIHYLSPYYGETPLPALYRDLATLTGWPVEKLPTPIDEGLSDWCEEQRRRGFLAITYDRSAGTFGLA